MGIGIDIERRFPTRMSIAKKVLTPNEINNLGNLDVSSLLKLQIILFVIFLD
jgi:4'-phosphopantetheinyl transferase EntD